MKWILYLLSIMAFIPTVKAQRMAPGQTGLEFQAGILKAEFPVKDYYIHAGIVVYKKNGNYISGSVQADFRHAQYRKVQVSHDTFLLEAGYVFYLIGTWDRSLNLNAGVQGTVGYEIINGGETVLYDGAVIESPENPVYGAGARLSLEKFLTNRILILIQGKFNVLWGTTMEIFRPSLGLGIRYHF